MAIFDIFEEVSGKAVTKTEAGDNRIFGVVIGEVVKNYDDSFPGRICVQIHTRDTDANVVKWARMAMAYSGKEWGEYFLPEIGDQVLVVFEEGIIDKPYVIGCINKTSDKFLSKSADKNNRHKRIVTRHGNSIEFDDAPDSSGNNDGDGSTDSIKIYTTKENSVHSHSIELNNEKNLIEVKDSEDKTQLQMKTEKGDILIKAERKITIKAGDNITIVLNGESGKITINSKDFSVDATGKMEMNATSKMALSGAQVTADAQGALKLNASGMVQVSGTPIKIG
ncbi:MAG: phage baseplate assembly protein V [Lachnospiraceae bacterium]|nr:phage baseplate assembly protein V [Lachnospiraceae bacterium]